MTDRLFDESAERAVLGACLVRNEALDEAAEILQPADFRRQHYGLIFEAMLGLHASRQAIDVVTLGELLTGKLESAHAELLQLMDGMPRSANVAYYAGIVKNKATIRRLCDAARKVLADADAGELSAAALLEEAEQAIYRLGSTAIKSDWVSGSEMAAELFPVLETLQSKREAVSGVATGLKEFDGITRGLQPGDLVLLGARPAMGKSAFALQVALTVARHSPVAFFSLEMGRQSVGLRAIASAGQLDTWRMLSGYLSDVELHRASHGLNVLGESKLYMDESPSVSPLQVRSRLRRLSARAGRVALVVIDYVQLLQPLPDQRRENRQAQVAGISRMLKLLAREFHTPFLALSQLNRTLERQAEKRPTMADLRESGALEQDADLVLLLHRPEVYEPHNLELKGRAELIIGKHRNGPTASIALQWQPGPMTFAECVA